MSATESVVVTRDLMAVQIPNGYTVPIKSGTRVQITQSLGGTYTVLTEDGVMARIAGDDAEAIGQKPQAQTTASSSDKPVTKEELEKWVMGQLRTVFDPEIPVNVVDLGLIYSCEITPLPEESNQYNVYVKMTLTAPGCGMGSVLKADAERKIMKLSGVKRADVEVVIDPPWDPSKMTEAAKLQLGML